jgi:hypothetical protein
MLPSNSTDNLLNSFPMFGHPGISALEYAGQVEKKRLSEVLLERTPTTNMPDQNTTAPTTTETELEAGELSPPLHFIDEFGCQQRRRGTFINHTPRNFEIRSSQPVEVYRPSRAESENYSRPLSRQSSRTCASPAITSQHGHSSSTNSGTLVNRSTLNHDDVTELGSTEIGLPPSPDVYKPSTRSHRRSLSAPQYKALAYRPSATSPASQPRRDFSFQNTSFIEDQPQEKKRQRRQTPFKVVRSKQISGPRHAPLEPWVAEHRRKQMSETIETIGDVPVDMDREVSAEMGTFGVIQRYFDSQGGGPVSAPKISPNAQLNNPPLVAPPDPPIAAPPKTPERDARKMFMEPLAVYPIDDRGLPNEIPPLPDRSPKRVPNPDSPTTFRYIGRRASDFNIAAEGQYSPYDMDNDVLHVTKKRDRERPKVGPVAWIGSPNVGRLAPPILGHDAITASSDLRLNTLSYYLKHTGPETETEPMTTQQQKKGMRLFKVKQRKTLAARVGSVEGSPQRMRSRPAVPSCAREMTTSGGARHLKIIIPTESPTGSQVVTLPMSKQRAQRRSRHIAISFTEEMLNPLASSAVENMLSTLDTPERSASAPIPRSPRSPRRSPKAIPVENHPLVASRDEATRARKLRDLQRIKRKPVPSTSDQDATSGALPTPAHTPEPVAASTSGDEEDEADDGSSNQMGFLQDKVMTLQRQNTQLAEALAKIVGLELEDGEVKTEAILEAFKRIRGPIMPGVA